MNRLLAIDVGFASTGWAVLDIVPTGGYKLLIYGCIKTEKSDKKKKLRVANDDIRRCEDTAAGLLDIIDSHRPSLVAVELPHGGGKSSRAVRSMGIATGVIGALSSISEKPFLYVTPSEVKIALHGTKTASKDDMMNSAMNKYPLLAEKKLPENRLEHIADAIGVAEAVKDDPLVRMLRSL